MRHDALPLRELRPCASRRGFEGCSRGDNGARRDAAHAADAAAAAEGGQAPRPGFRSGASQKPLRAGRLPPGGGEARFLLALLVARERRRKGSWQPGRAVLGRR